MTTRTMTRSTIALEGGDLELARECVNVDLSCALPDLGELAIEPDAISHASGLLMATRVLGCWPFVGPRWPVVERVELELNTAAAREIASSVNAELGSARDFIGRDGRSIQAAAPRLAQLDALARRLGADVAGPAPDTDQDAPAPEDGGTDGGEALADIRWLAREVLLDAVSSIEAGGPGPDGPTEPDRIGRVLDGAWAMWAVGSPTGYSAAREPETIPTHARSYLVVRGRVLLAELSDPLTEMDPEVVERCRRAIEALTDEGSVD